MLVLPAMPFGIAPGFAAFPGTVSLRPQTLVAVSAETLDTLHGQGFRRFLVVNGHGGNMPAAGAVEWRPDRRADSLARLVGLARRPGGRRRGLPGEATHASWFENFPWTRLAGVELPAEEKPMVTDREALRELEPPAVRERRSATARTAGRTRFPTSRRCGSGRPASRRYARLIERL